MVGYKNGNWLVNPQKGQNYFGIGAEKSVDITHPIGMPAGWKSMDELKRGAGHQGWTLERQQAEWAKQNAKEDEQIAARRLANMQKENGMWQANSTAMDYYAQQREKLMHGGGGDSFGKNDSLFSHAEAGTPTAEQLATEGQIAMPEIVPPETSPIEDWFNFDGAIERLAEFGTQIYESLSTAMEGAGEIFSGLGDSISAGLETASIMATGALESIKASFTLAKETIQSTWAEIPGFFSGVFDGLGGVAASAGSAIYSGLTSICGAVISAWQSVSSAVSSIIASISAAASSISLPSFGGGVGKAEGGFVSTATHYFAGEHGPEVIIPLGSVHRARALDLLEKTADILFGGSLDFGGDEIDNTVSDLMDGVAGAFGSGGGDENSIFEGVDSNLPIVPKIQTSPTGAQVSMGGIQVSFDISGVEDAQGVMEVIRENFSGLADDLSSKLAESLLGTWEKLVGNVNNDENGRATVMASAQRIINEMVAEGKLVFGSYVELDPRYKPEGDSSWFRFAILDLDSLEKIYSTFVFRYNQTFSDD